MIYLLHGDDINSSYRRLLDLLNLYPGFEKLRITPENQDQLTLALFSQDLVSNKKIIICEDLLSQKADLKLADLAKKPEDRILIFWEKKLLTPAAIQKIAKMAKVEVFKRAPQLFWFLDVIGPDGKQTLKAFSTLSAEKGIMWHITARILSMTLATLGAQKHDLEDILGRHLLDWQFLKIREQAKHFQTKNLIKFYRGLIRTDYLIKTGKTNLDENSLLPLLLLKYLKND